MPSVYAQTPARKRLEGERGIVVPRVTSPKSHRGIFPREGAEIGGSLVDARGEDMNVSGGARGAPYADMGSIPDDPVDASTSSPADARVAIAETEGDYYAGDDGSRWTVDEAIDGAGFGRFQLVMLFFTGLAWMGDAMEMMLLSFLGPSVRCEWGVNPAQEGRLTSVVFVGMLFGAPTWGLVADARGRRVAFFCTTLVTFLAGLLSAASPTFGFLLFARGLVGFGLGGLPTAFSLFMEFLPSADRGVWLVAIEVFWTLGSVIEAGLAWAILPHHSWRVLLLVSTIPLGILLCAMYFVPESPFYTAAKGDAAATRRTLARVCRVNGRGAALPKGILLLPSSVSSSWGDRADDPWWRRAIRPFRRVGALLRPESRVTTVSLWFIFFAVAFSYYGVVLLTTEVHVDTSASRDDGRTGGSRGGDDLVACTSHGSPDLPNRAYGDIFASSTAELPGLLLAAIAVDRIGRRRSMGAALSLNSVFTLPLIAYASISAGGETFCLVAARCFIMAAFTVLYVYAPETQPTAVRATAMGVGNVFARLGGILCPLFAVEMVENGKLAGAAATFAALAAVTAAVAFHLPVETAGKRLDDGAGDVELTAGKDTTKENAAENGSATTKAEETANGSSAEAPRPPATQPRHPPTEGVDA